MKKITPVFGPQELFDKAHDNHLFAIQAKVGIHFFIAVSTAIEAAINMNKDEFIQFAQRRIEEAPDSIDLTGDIDELITPEFNKWWEEEGEFIRSGGGNYERSFAYGAFRYLMPKILGHKQPEPKRWTVEDQKAGKLPEVGCFVSSNGKNLEFVGVCVNEKLWTLRNRDGECFRVLTDQVNPIETPDERAARGA